MSTDPTRPARIAVAYALAPFLNDGYLKSSAATATLARWRRAVGKTPAQAMDVWPTMLAGIPGNARCDDGTPTRAENAAFTALSLFALAQQSRTTCIHTNDKHASFAAACRQLANQNGRGDGASPLDRRVAALLTATSWTETTNHLRSLTNYMRTNNHMTLNVYQFADDLYDLQFRSRQEQVQLRWARHYYTTPTTDQQKDN